MIQRRYYLRGPKPPSNRALWARVALYAVLLAAILIAQHEIGNKAASCLALFGN